eukprot:GHVQ01032794.1.p1 GENE.GHVQ01032794.1~~GHVQ01032794.1.p1  ORF type:complete len:274 (-),score=36.47 GHVQ01032794.1:1033-1854(-)
MSTKGRWRRDLRPSAQSPINNVPAAQKQNLSQTLSAPTNTAGNYATSIYRGASDFARCSTTLGDDVSSVFDGQTVYLQSFLSRPNDYSLYHKLKAELNITDNDTSELTDPPEFGVKSYSQHMIHPSPESSPTYTALIQQLESYFSIDIHACRLNYYRSGKDWKPFHHDSHAYSHDKHAREDFTIGGSLGETRELAFRHVDSGVEFRIPQCNGDVFGFNSNVNKLFMHGVPSKSEATRSTKKTTKEATVEGRISVIAWGKRRSLNERNAGRSEL